MIVIFSRASGAMANTDSRAPYLIDAFSQCMFMFNSAVDNSCSGAWKLL